jgi:hypothetical protein
MPLLDAGGRGGAVFHLERMKAPGTGEDIIQIPLRERRKAGYIRPGLEAFRQAGAVGEISIDPGRHLVLP